jgi:hypothetical protein
MNDKPSSKAPRKKAASKKKSAPKKRVRKQAIPEVPEAPPVRFDVVTMAKLHRSEAYPGGIASANALEQQCGMWPVVASTAWFARYSGKGWLSTIGQICAGLNCGPSDFLIVRDDLLKAEGDALHQARLKLGLTRATFAKVFSARAGFWFEEDAVKAWEEGHAKVREGIWQAIAMMILETITTTLTLGDLKEDHD